MAAVTICAVFSIVCILAKSATSTIYSLDDSKGLGRKFDGIGGLSGGGATSKLLVNYPQQYREEILDYLFKPNFGASLQILKVEIGGDVQSTDGTEASHMHNSWEENYQRGYEWWLMVEAKKRNPNIKLYGLPWGFPGWIGVGGGNPYVNPNMTADYIVRWIVGAKRFYNLTIDFIGIWNERPYDSTYIKTLRAMLDSRGFTNTRIVASDGGWDISGDILKDSALAAAVDYIGCHYPGTWSSSDAQKTGKQLWASEDYSTFNDEVGGGCWARILNQNYVNGYMTATISWNLIASYYNPLPFYRDGLMTAVEPWSGNYVVETPIWLSAHTTQFTEIGWTYLLHGAGVGMLENGGSYVALVSPDGKDLTIIVETMSHDHSVCIRPNLPWYTVSPQNATFNLSGSFASIPQLNVWYSQLVFDGNASVMFENLKPIKANDGQVTVSLGVDEVYTLTTLSSGQKGQYNAPPPSQPFPLPYSENFESYQISQEPSNLAQQTGSFEVVTSDSAHGRVLRQMMLEDPVAWCDADAIGASINMIGNYNWSEIYLEVDVSLGTVNRTEGVFIAGRVQNGGCDAYKAIGVFFFFFPEARIYIVATDLARTQVLSTGRLQASLPAWNKLSLLITSGAITGWLNNKQVFSVSTPSSPANGFVALGTDTYGIADFDNFNITTSWEGMHRMHQHELVGSSKLNSLYFLPEIRKRH